MNYFSRFSGLFAVGIFLFCPLSFVTAASVGDIVNFNIDKNFDTQQRDQLQAQLVKVSDNLYVYVEKDWLDSQSQGKRNLILDNLSSLVFEFKEKIYPQLTSTFGTEPNPGIDKDEKITLLLHQMHSAESGYFREADEYDKLQISYSNQREMLYLSSDIIGDPIKAKTVLAHEFTHLIDFKQKNINFTVSEETWLNEARADYSSKILGYDKEYQGSNLQQRVLSFLSSPSDSITEWKGTEYDYGSVRLFTEYLVEHYGINILVDSLHSPYVGVKSLDYALKQSDSKEDFSQIFTNWVVSSVLNDCSIKNEYCYTDSNLKSLRLVPTIYFLPLSGNSSLSINNFTKNWSGSWLKLIGGNGDVQINFSTTKGLNFKIPYITTNTAGQNSVGFMLVDQYGKGNLRLTSFDKDYKSVILMPILMSASYQADYLEPIYPYTFSIAVASTNNQGDNQADLTQQLLNKIADLEKQIADLKNKINQDQNFCTKLDKDLSVGIRNSQDVKCLQQFLKNQGSDIYPEGLVTGNFLDLTRKAVIRFQKKYNILQTGYVGPITRAKINSLISK